MSATFLLTSFIFIFLAAAPGRTTFILVMLASQGRLKNIFAGAAAAFFIQSFISVLLGEVLALFPLFIVNLLAGALFIYFAYSFWSQSKETIELRDSDKNISIKSVFLIVFMAEFGDVSQLAIAATAAKSSSKFSIFALSLIALWTITGIALLVGYNLKRLIKPSLIQKTASIVFLVIGVYLLFQSASFSK
jgi:Ca2+/H+ antiporter, TMEM165/GDT1 family